MNLTESEKMTIKRAFIIYERCIPRGLRNKGFFIDSYTAKEDIKNMINLKSKLEGS